MAKTEILQIISSMEAAISHDAALNPLLQRLRHQIDENYEAMAIDLSNAID